MKTLQQIYRLAERKNITVDRFALKNREALSIMEDDGACFVAVDPEKIKSEADERTKLAHEVGHCVKGAFYNKYSSFDNRQKHENRADKWAIRKLIPATELDDAVAAGHTQLWDLADYFGVTEAFMRKAVSLYTHGNVAAELYF